MKKFLWTLSIPVSLWVAVFYLASLPKPNTLSPAAFTSFLLIGIALFGVVPVCVLKTLNAWFGEDWL